MSTITTSANAWIDAFKELKAWFARLASGMFYSGFWCVLTMFFGLLQIFLLYGKSMLLPTYLFPYDDLLRGGSILFFCGALVASIAVDGFLSADNSMGKKLAGLVYALIPFLIVLSIAVVYIWVSGATTADLSALNFSSDYRRLNLAILVITLVYAFSIKSAEKVLADIKGQKP